MNIIKKLATSMGLLVISSYTFSGADKIQWVLTQDFPSEIISSGGIHTASYIFTNVMPFKMVNPLYILKTSNPSSEFRYYDKCSGKRLSYLESCVVTINLNADTDGEKIVQLTESYGYYQVPIPALSTNARGGGSRASISVTPTTLLPASMNVGGSAPWKFTYTNNGTQTATGLHIKVYGSSYNTNCGLHLSNIPPNNTCYVQGTYTAAAAGAHTITSNLSYAQGASVKASTSTIVNGTSSGLQCSAAVPLAPQTLVNSINSPVTLLCTNKSGDNLTITGHTTVYPNNVTDGVFTIDAPGGDSCTNQVLPNNASCQLKGKYDAPAVAIDDITISLSVDYDTPSTPGLMSQTSTTTDVVTTINNTREITLKNKCNFDVWWSMVGGAVSGSPSCASCPTGSTCNVSANVCYYNNYGPKTGAYKLDKLNGEATTEIIQTDASTLSDDILWKGIISASTKCNGTSCANNACQNNGGTTSCAVGVGFGQPATEAEFTFKLAGVNNKDTYDISNVNGFSMPISMTTSETASDYFCGGAGNHLAEGSLKACNFSSVSPPTNMYYWVEKTSTACTSKNTCSNNNLICGLAFDPTSNNFKKNCGAFLGYWAANQICQTNPSFTSPFGDGFHCDQYLTTPFPNNTYTLTQLLKCSPPNTNAPLFNSCYLGYSGFSSTQLQQCCGCTNWSGIANPEESCPVGQTDPQWTSYVEPRIRWMKKACPTSYSYPFDDKASTFQCTASSTTKYTITFCPGGGTGLPSGKTEGR